MRTLFNQIKVEMEITQMKERVLVYVAEKQSVGRGGCSYCRESIFDRHR